MIKPPTPGTTRSDGAIYSDAHDGKLRWLYRRSCRCCGKEFLHPRHIDAKYCSGECSALGRQSRVEHTCAKCGVVFSRRKSSVKDSRSGVFFCSRKCKDVTQRLDGETSPIRPSHYSDGHRTYRMRALRLLGARCQRCGYKDDDRMLDVHHVDSDRDNNVIANLEVLCVWCHALETRKSWKSVVDQGTDD